MFSTASRIALASILFFICCQNASCADSLKSNPDNVLIDGVTNFLADRAQANAAYIFTSKLRNNRALQCYLPRTYETIQSTNLILLLKTSSHIWRDRIEEDLKFATILSLLIKDKGYDDTKKLKAAELGALLAGFLKRTNQQDRIEDIKNDIDKITARIGEIKSKLANEQSHCRFGEYQIVEAGENSKQIDARESLEIIKAGESLKKYIAILEELKNKLAETTPPAKPSSGTIEVFNALTSLYTSISDISDSKESKKTSYSTVAVNLINLMEAICNTKNSSKATCDAARVKDNKPNESETTCNAAKVKNNNSNESEATCNAAKVKDNNSNEYESNDDRLNKAKTHILFFASLADAETSDQVTVTLQNFMLPPVSFGEIREKNHWAIAAYVGGSISIAQRSRPGLFAPVGIQGSFACSDRPATWFDNKSWCPHGGSVAILFSPFDFAYPLNLKFKGANNTATWNDVMSPSIAVAYGLAKEPINFGIAWQRVNQGLNNPNSTTRFLVFIALDMPLYIVH